MQFLLPPFQICWAYVRKARLKIPLYFRKIYFNLVVFLSLVLFLTGTSIIFYTYNEFLQDFSSIIDEKIDSVSEVTVHRVNNFLSPIEDIAETCSFIFKAVGPEATSFQMFHIILGFLRSFPQVNGIVVIEDSGRGNIFSRVQRTQLKRYSVPREAAFKQEIIRPNSRTHPYEEAIFFDKKGQKISPIPKDLEPEEARGDPRKMEWYTHVKKTGRPYLTSLSLLYNENVGLTLAYPLTHPETNKFAGVVGIEVNIHQLSNLVKMQSIGNLGLACIIQKNGDVIAHPDIQKIFNLTMQGIKIEKIQNIEAYHLNQAFEAFTQGRQEEFVSKKRTDFFHDIVRFEPLEKWGKKDSLWNDYILAIAFLGDRLSAHIQQARKDMLIFSGIMLLIAGVFMFMIAQRVSQPIVKIVSYLKKIQNMDFDITFDSSPYFYEIFQTVEVLKRVVQSLQAFSKFVPKALVKQLFYAKKEAVLGGERKLLTILFSDIKDFTKITEKLDGESLMLHLSDYFEALTHVIQDNNGIIDKYIGDAIMSFWGAPVADEQQAAHACQTALESQKQLKLLNQRWESQGKPPLVSRFGISTGEVIVGNIGSFDRFQYTALGDDVNMASRLEGSNKYYGTSILVSESTYLRVKRQFIFRPVDLVALKGKENAVRIYELLGEVGVMPPSEESRLVEFCLRTEEAFQFYLDRQWETAIRRYKYILREFGEDFLSKVFIERCSAFLKAPPPLYWDGVQHMQVK